MTWLDKFELSQKQADRRAWVAIEVLNGLIAADASRLDTVGDLDENIALAVTLADKLIAELEKSQ